LKKTTFTDTMIRKLKPADKKIIRGEGNGFSIRVMPSGTKSWLYAYNFDGRRREMSLGTYPEITLETARTRFEDARRLVKNGMDPMAAEEDAKEARRTAPTVAEFVEDYLERHAKRFKRSWKKDEQILNREVIPVWGKRKLASITNDDIERLNESIINRNAPGMANNCFQIVRKMFNFAVEKKKMPYSPCSGIKLPAVKNARDRTLNPDEIKDFWNNIDQCAMSEGVRSILKLILVTGQRPNEVAGMHSSEIDGHWWTIPVERLKVPKKMEHMRSPHRVYLSDLALELIGDVKDKGYIFPSPIKKIDRPMGDTAIDVAVDRNRAFPMKGDDGKPLYDDKGQPVTENRWGIEHFTPHDLRRTGATCMAQMKISDEVIDAILDHAKMGVIKVYNQYKYDDEKQVALESWERKLRSIITGEKGNVIPMIR